MKIYPGPTPKSPVVDPGKTDKTSGQKDASPGSFEAILNEKKRAMAVEGPHGVTPTGEFRPIASPQKTQEEALSYASESLDLLDHLQHVLTSSETEPEKLMPYIEEVMHERINGLIALRDELAPEDPLRETVNEVGVKIAVEAYKIHRGDYTSG